MKRQSSSLFWTFIWCWFMGITAISIGFGALFPSMNRVAKPFVCPHGSMELETQRYNPYPGSTITTLTWYCVDTASREKTELGIIPMSLYAGTIYGLLLFGLVYLIVKLRNNRPQPVVREMHRQVRMFPDHPTSDDTMARMRQLKELREANLIDEREYEEKRAEILRGL